MNGWTKPSIRLLVTFAAVARTGSMTAAAADLGYVPSAVSQHIAALERALGGVELFKRMPGRRISITAAGRALLDGVNDLLGATAQFVDLTAQIAGGEGYEIRVGAYGTAISHLLPPILEAAVAGGRFPSIRLRELETADGLPLLERGDLEMLIALKYRNEDPPRQSRTLALHHIGDERLVLVTASNGAGEPTRTFDDCLTASWVAGARGNIDREQLDQWTRSAKVPIDVRYETPDYQIAVELIAHDVAVGFVPFSILSAGGNRDRLTPVHLPEPLTYPSRRILVARRASTNLRVVDIIINQLRRCFADLPSDDFSSRTSSRPV